MPANLETAVLIAGGGPVGLSAAIELGWRGVPAILVTDKLDTAQHPKCNSTNSRSMEHFRRLGLARDLRAAALPAHIERASSYVTRFCGIEFGRLPRPYTNWATPEIPNNVSQMVLEQVLRRHAEQQAGVEVRFGCRLVSWSENVDGIAAHVETASGEQLRINARFLLGADGASSLVRRTLGVGMTGEDGSIHRAFMGGTMLSYYIRAPQLAAASGRTQTHSTWIINPQMRGLMFSQDGKERWVVHYQVPPGVDAQRVDGHAIVKQLLGSEVPFEIISGGPWTGGLAMVAERYQAGNVFLAGDAAHLFTPLGGMGMNTGIGDVMNLCWKIAAVHQGWGSARLLASYDSERRPIGVRNAGFGVRCSRVMDGWAVPEDFEAGTPEAQAARAALGAQILVEDVPQYLSAGLQLGELYEGSPVICGDATPAPEDRWDVYAPIDRAGARAPHFLLEPDALGRAVAASALPASSGRAPGVPASGLPASGLPASGLPASGLPAYDHFGQGFTLLNFGAPGAGAALEAAARDRHVPLKTLTIGRSVRPYQHALVLVRPDQHIAWHGDALTAEQAEAVIDRVRGM